MIYSIGPFSIKKVALANAIIFAILFTAIPLIAENMLDGREEVRRALKEIVCAFLSYNECL